MYEAVKLLKYKEDKDGTELIIKTKNKDISKLIKSKSIKSAEIRFDDGRHISSDQRKKIYATINDISLFTGYLPEEQKEWLKYLHIERTGARYISLSDCSMDEARDFINTILEYALTEGIPLSEPGICRADDIEKYLYYCIKNKRCAVCGRPGEIHHVDTIGMGNDRRKVDDKNHRKICLCRTHHTIAHQKGMIDFQKSYHVYGIKGCN